MIEKLTPLKALERLRDYENLASRNPVAYLLEQDNLSAYYKIIENALKLFNLLNENDIDIWLLKHCDYENYCRIRRLCLEGTGNADKCSDCDIEIIDLPSKEEFDSLKENLL